MGIGLHSHHFPYTVHMVISGSDVGGWDNVLYISSPPAFKYSLASDSWLLGLPKVPKRLELKPGLTCLHAWMWLRSLIFEQGNHIPGMWQSFSFGLGTDLLG